MSLKVCKICGKKFETGRGNRKTCSPECQKNNKKLYDSEYDKANKEKINAKYKERYRRKKQITKYCVLCGGKLANNRQLYCLDCILRDFKYGNGKAIQTAKDRLYSRGYNLQAAWAEIEKRGI